jgi:hypothetical protein
MKKTKHHDPFCSAAPADGFYVDVTGTDEDGLAIGCAVQEASACDEAAGQCATKAGSDINGKDFIEIMACVVRLVVKMLL